MMTLKNLTYLSLITAVAGACDVEQALGDTATTGESSGGSGGSGSGGTSGGADSGKVDTGPWDDTGATEGATSTGFADTGVLDTGPWDDTGDETGGPLDLCEASEPQVSWDSSGLAPAALGFDGSFVGVGTCGVLVEPTGFVDVALITLTCVLSGSRDGTDFVDEAISIRLEFSSDTNAVALLPSFWETVRARFVVESAGLGQGTARYVVLEQPMLPGDGDAPVLIATDAARWEPNPQSYDSWHTGSWFGGPSIAPIDASCATGNAPKCGFDVALEAGWLDRSPPAVHGGQAAEFLAPTEEGTYEIYVDTAWQAPQSFKCGEDFPSAAYSFVAFGATPS